LSTGKLYLSFPNIPESQQNPKKLLRLTIHLPAYWFGYGYSGVMSGIFFQSEPYPLIVSGFFSASFILGSFTYFLIVFIEYGYQEQVM
jgi:hypothetical protein